VLSEDGGFFKAFCSCCLKMEDFFENFVRVV
jgi:hypothetical protein